MQISSQLKNKWHTQILKNVIEEKGQQKTKYNGKMTKYSRKNMDRRVADLGSDSTLDSRLKYNLPTLILPFAIHSINMKCLPWAKYHAKGVALCPLSPSTTGLCLRGSYRPLGYPVKNVVSSPVYPETTHLPHVASSWIIE